MADRSDEENLHIPTNNQSENRSDEIIPTTDTDTITQNQEIENMEVHHHPDLYHKSKKWKEYFLEFLMIFLAVTLGFFAENMREYIKDRTEIKSNMQSMVADLQSDVNMYDAAISTNKLSDRRIDTLISLLKLDRSNTSRIYFLARSITANNSIYTPDTKTFEQMKSSDALKLIESGRVADSISDYYQSLQFYKSQNDLQRQKITDVHLVNSQLFDGYVFQQMFSKVKTNFDVDITQPAGNPPLLSNDFNAINKVIIAYHYLYSTTEINTKAAEETRKHALRLIGIIKNEYRPG